MTPSLQQQKALGQLQNSGTWRAMPTGSGLVRDCAGDFLGAVYLLLSSASRMANASSVASKAPRSPAQYSSSFGMFGREGQRLGSPPIGWWLTRFPSSYLNRYDIIAIAVERRKYELERDDLILI
eukprot:scaffold922_cov327-Pinguiococcus_pyrenoidosus.AAC.19